MPYNATSLLLVFNYQPAPLSPLIMRNQRNA